MEPLCICDLRLILQFGSPSTRGLGKTSLLGYWFDDKLQESLFTDVSDAAWRDGCMDVIFAEQFTIFDMHGTPTDIKLIRSIQPYANMQLVYVTDEDWDGNFLETMVSKTVPHIGTIVVILQPKYDDSKESERLIERFRERYQRWANVQWTSAPIMNLRTNLTPQKLIRRNKQLREAFRKLLPRIEIQPGERLCRSAFQIQSAFYDSESSIISSLFSQRPKAEFRLTLLIFLSFSDDQFDTYPSNV